MRATSRYARSSCYLIPPRLEQRWAVRWGFILTALSGVMAAGRSALAADELPAEPEAAAVPAPATLSMPTHHFYSGVDYGTQALANPLWVFVNRGYDVIQDHIVGRDVFNLPYASNAANVGRNVVNPLPAISDDGWGKFLREEIFPLSYGNTTARWIPNYSLHLIGGGVTYAELDEWAAVMKERTRLIAEFDARYLEWVTAARG